MKITSPVILPFFLCVMFHSSKVVNLNRVTTAYFTEIFNHFDFVLKPLDKTVSFLVFFPLFSHNSHMNLVGYQPSRIVQTGHFSTILGPSLVAGSLRIQNTTPVHSRDHMFLVYMISFL